MKQLRIFLVDTIDLQADFLVERYEALPKMLAATSTRNGGRSRSNSTVCGSAQGCYALIDYELQGKACC